VLAQQRKIKHQLKLIRFEEVNDQLELLRAGDIIGRTVIKF
jgi:alcohol dehydrogenase, propanol-preferring